MRLRILAAVAAALVGVAIGLGLTYLWTSPEQVVRVVGGSGDAQIGGPFDLVDHTGTARRDTDYRGKLMLVFFGYTFCPDACPLSLQHTSETMDLLGPAADGVQPLFISVDPERDTQAVLRSYMEHFSPRLVGLTGTPERLAAAARAYRVYYRVAGDPKSDPNYLIDHSTIVYLMGKDGRYLTHFTHETPPEKMAETIRRYL